MLGKRRSWLRLGALLLIVVVIIASGWLVIGVTITIPAQRPIDQLTAARATWQAHKPTDYEMWVGVGSFSMIGSYKISVKNHQVVSILDGNLQSCDTCQLKAADEQTMRNYQRIFSNSFPPTMNDLTMDTLFTFAADKLKDEPAPPIIAMCSAVDVEQSRYEMTYDQEKGYITSLRYTNCSRFNFGGGLMCAAVSECNAAITISSVQSQE